MSDSLTFRESFDGVEVLTLNRPAKRNALSRALRSELVDQLDDLEKDSSVRAVVLAAVGPVFCAGFDREELAAGDAAEVFADAAPYHERLHTFGKPLIAAVGGPALGGGCDLALLCDFRVASSTASFGQPQVRFGAPALYELMREVIGVGAAREMCLTGRRYDAREALAIGLVNRIVEPENLLSESVALATEIATLPEGLPVLVKQSFLRAQPKLFGD